MIYIFLVLIGLGLSLLNLTANKGLKFVYTLAVLITMVFLMGTVSPYHSFDTASYEYMYSWVPDSHRLEIGYMNFSYLFYKNGFSYESFRIFSYALFIILMFIGIRELTPNLIGFYSLYLIFPFFLDVTQVRQFFMNSLVLLGVGLFSKNEKFCREIGILAILVSPLFQTSGIIYYLLFILYKVNLKKMLKLMDYLIWILPIITIIMHYAHLNKLISGILALLLSSRSNQDDAVALYTQGASFSTVILYILSIMMGYFVYKKFILNVREYDSIKKKLLTSIFFIGVISIPLLSSSSDFERFIRNSILILIIVFSIYVYQIKKIGSHIWLRSWGIMLCIFLLTTASWKYWDTSSTGRNQFLPYIIKIKNSNEV